MLLDQMRPVVLLVQSSVGQGAHEGLDGWRLGHYARPCLVGWRLKATEEVGHQLRDRLARAPGVGLGSADQALFEAEGKFGLHEGS
jgi:hypothetical protein